MPKVTIYIKDENWPKWLKLRSIGEQSSWVNELLKNTDIKPVSEVQTTRLDARSTE